MKTITRVLLSLAILVLAILFVVWAWSSRSKPEEKEPIRILPRVEALRVQSGGHRLEVVTHGTVQARTETILTSEVSGLIVEVSPSFFPGKAFQIGEVLLRLDATEHRFRRADAKSRLSQAKLALEEERAFSEQALEDWKDLGRGEAGDLALRKPQFDRAQAAMEAAQAALDLAERNLRLTEIRAPYAGRIREKYVDIGQVVSARATQLARIYSVDVAEIRLPVSAQAAAYFDLPEDFGDGRGEVERPTVILEFDYAGKRVSWRGSAERVEGAIDLATRQIVVVAQVLNPYAQDENSDRPPLKVGQFVTARIQGHYLENATIIPRGALHGDAVYVIDETNHMRIRPVGVVQKGIEEVVLDSGLMDGELICLTPLEFSIDGMEVILERTIVPGT